MNLSIIIPAYNVADYLPKCLDSILSQNCDDVEVICINDGSTDNTGCILSELESTYTNVVAVNQANAGMSASRNKGLDIAKGEYVMFVDSDDWLEPESLNVLLATVSGEDVVEFQCRKFYEEQSRYSESEEHDWNRTSTGWDYFNQTRLVSRDIHFVCIWQRLYRREFLLKNNLRFEESVRRAEDDLFTTMVMWHAQSVKTCPVLVYNYRVRSNSITTTVSIDRWYDSIRVQEILADFFVDKVEADMSVMYRVLASNYINWFSRKTIALYGNQDVMLRNRINWNYFKTVAVTKRHKRLYRLIFISPKLYRTYEKVVDR